MQLFTSERGSIEIPFSRHPAIGAAQLLFRALEHSHCLYPLLSPASLSHRSNRYGQYRIASSFPSCISVAITLSGYLYVYHHLVYDHFRRNPWRAFSALPPPFPFPAAIHISDTHCTRIFAASCFQFAFHPLHPRYIYSLVYSASPPLFAFLLLHTLDQTGYRTYPNDPSVAILPPHTHTLGRVDTQ